MRSGKLAGGSQGRLAERGAIEHHAACRCTSKHNIKKILGYQTALVLVPFFLQSITAMECMCESFCSHTYHLNIPTIKI